ncbi:MAG TPA: hypothetical protein VFN42_06560 [Acetobacteraceae bacterium]|nr:hypothetical protein [Acetobacteraceae bacterium]
MIARAVLPLLAAGLLLSGCKAVPQIAGVVTGGAIGVATASPALGFAVGVATDTATTAGLQWYGRSRANAEQNAIARIAGGLELGQQHAWHIHHIIPFGDEHGELYVVRVIAAPLTVCKQIVFSVDDGQGAALHQAWYVASVCRQGQDWKWADAEPAVSRWGYLQ